MHIPPRFSAAQIRFHTQPIERQFQTPNGDNAWLLKELDKIGEMTEKSPFKDQFQGLDSRVQIDFFPHQINGIAPEAGKEYKVTSLAARIATDNEQQHNPVFLERGLHWSPLCVFDKLESLKSFLNKVLSAARVMNRTLNQDREHFER